MEYLELIYKHWFITCLFLFLFPFRYGTIFKWSVKMEDGKFKKDN